MRLGTLDWVPAEERRDLLAEPVALAVDAMSDEVAVAPIDPALSDTVTFCERTRFRWATRPTA